MCPLSKKSQVKAQQHLWGCLFGWEYNPLRQNFPLEPANYQQFKGHGFEKQFWENIADNIQEHQKQFKSWKEISHQKAEKQQVLGCR